MQKEIASVYHQNVSYRVNRRTGIVSGTENGETFYPDEKTAEKIRRIVARRDKAAQWRRERESILRDMGMVKVRGALGGTHWE